MTGLNGFLKNTETNKNSPVLRFCMEQTIQAILQHIEKIISHKETKTHWGKNAYFIRNRFSVQNLHRLNFSFVSFFFFSALTFFCSNLLITKDAHADE